MRDMMKDRGQIGIRNLMLAGAVGAIACVVTLVWGVSGVDPSLWDEFATVSGLRPPRDILPGFWRILTGWMFSLFGVSAATVFLKFLGAVSAGACTALAYLIARQVLALLTRTSRPFPVWYRRIAPFFSFVAAFLFGVSDPLARVSQVFSPDGLRLLMVLVVVHLVLRWFTVGGRWRIFPAMALMGLLAAETPFGFVLPLAFVGSYAVVWWCIMDAYFRKPEKLPDPSELPKWRMFFLFLGGLALGVWLNGLAFVLMGGATAHGWSTSMVYFRYGTGYWLLLKGSASLIGWVLGLGFCVVPLVVAIRLFPMLVRDDRPMPFARGALLFFVGILALMQCGAVPATRFWVFSAAMVRSGFLLAFLVFCAMLTVALFGAAFAFECQRTYMNDEDGPRPGVLLRGLAPTAALVVLVLAAVSVPKPVETEMQRIVDAAVAETVEECGDAKWLFTDGCLDAGVELEAKRRGRQIRALNMMSGANPWEIWVRSRGFEPGSEDCKAAQTGIPALLRIWAGEKVNGMDGVALQLGFEFWKREQKPLPKASGMLAREKGMGDKEAQEGIDRATEIAKRILEVAGKVDGADPSAALASAFSAVNWRISRFARQRNDMEIANGLDLANSVLRKMLSAIEYERQRTFMQLTPREGLEIALRRMNFVEARKYSASVLKNDADDPQANFAMGMSAIMDKRYKDAEFYLRNVLKRRPKEAAALNNLSIVCRKQRKYKEAEDFARQAQEILPGSTEVQNTLADALKKAP